MRRPTGAEVGRDRNILYAATFLRAVATGMVGVVLGLYLARRGLPASTLGLVIGAGLLGTATAMAAATFFGDAWGRKRFLVGVSALAVVGTLLAVGASSPLLIGVGAFAGMLNGMGRDRGAALVLETAILPSTTTDEGRTRAFAVYNVLQDAGHALGSLLAALPAALRASTALDEADALRATLAVNALLLLATALLYLRLTFAVEAGPVRHLTVSKESRGLLVKICSLFAFDSLAGGLLTTSLLSVFFFERFGASEAAIGVLFFLSRVLNALSHLGAAWLARRIGLVNTMVFTHVPSSLLLMTVPFAPNFPVAAALFLLREGLVEMDVPTRQSYVMAVVRPEERTVAAGLTNLVRTGAWAVGPAFAGLFMQGVSMATPLFVGSAMKIVYDGLLWAAFRKVRPPEERQPRSRGEVARRTDSAR